MKATNHLLSVVSVLAIVIGSRIGTAPVRTAGASPAGEAGSSVAASSVFLERYELHPGLAPAPKQEVGLVVARASARDRLLELTRTSCGGSGPGLDEPASWRGLAWQW